MAGYPSVQWSFRVHGFGVPGLGASQDPCIIRCSGTNNLKGVHVLHQLFQGHPDSTNANSTANLTWQYDAPPLPPLSVSAQARNPLAIVTT